MTLATALALIPPACSHSLPKWIPGGWYADYESAERAAAGNRPLLIYFKDPRRGIRDPVQEALRSDPVSRALGDHVGCVLSKSYPPDRRYLAQFGVERAPALVVVHPDGTFHATSKLTNREELFAFLASAEPPGAAPIVDPFVPRSPAYHWLDSPDDAVAAASRTGRSAVIVFYRSWSGDWITLHKLLATYEVYSRLDSLVHCRFGVWGVNRNQHTTRFGNLRLPAIVIARPDGTDSVVELPTSSEAVARFVDDTLHPDKSMAAMEAAAGATTALPGGGSSTAGP
jgi:hypothetical protein